MSFNAFFERRYIAFYKFRPRWFRSVIISNSSDARPRPNKSQIETSLCFVTLYFSIWIIVLIKLVFDEQ